MVDLNIYNETSQLESVVLGNGTSMGAIPKSKNAIDPKSKLHVINGTYPSESDVINELRGFSNILTKYNVQVFRPENIINLNQVFARDIGIAIGDKFIVPKILEDRSPEIKGIQYLINQFHQEKILHAPNGVRLEGGDIIPYNGKLFVGYSKSQDFQRYKVARTNEAGLEFLKTHFPNWELHSFELNKSDDDLAVNTLHLDCCFQPIGNGKAIIDERGFKNKNEFHVLLSLFGKENCFLVEKEEMDAMTSNIFSINPLVVVSEKRFHRLNEWLIQQGFTVEEISYGEVSKMGGLFRCTTMPLKRK